MQASDGVIAASTERQMDKAPPASAPNMRLQRNLKIVVVALAILIFAGLLTVIGRVIYLASHSTTQPAVPTPAVRPEHSLKLPPGAKVRSASLDGNRLVVLYDAGERSAIAVFDLARGELITTIAIAPGADGR